MVLEARRSKPHEPGADPEGRIVCDVQWCSRPGGRSRMNWDGDAYQERFDALAASGTDVHGEAAFVMAYAPRTVLDAGCGTGRVAIELARRGVAVAGADVDPSMIATARRRAPAVTWYETD